jgi:hypothetical protein
MPRPLSAVYLPSNISHTRLHPLDCIHRWGLLLSLSAKPPMPRDYLHPRDPTVPQLVRYDPVPYVRPTAVHLLWLRDAITSQRTILLSSLNSNSTSCCHWILSIADQHTVSSPEDLLCTTDRFPWPLNSWTSSRHHWTKTIHLERVTSQEYNWSFTWCGVQSMLTTNHGREAPVQEGSDLKYEVFQEEGMQRAGPLRPSYFLHKSFVSVYYVMIREL